MRFYSAPVIRLADARQMELAHTIKADGRWRLISFVGRDHSTMTRLCAFLASDAKSPTLWHTPEGHDIDSVIDLRAVFQTAHRDMDVATLPELLMPSKGKHGFVDYEKVYCPDLKDDTDIFQMRGIDRTHGALIIVRPDQYVARIQALSDTAGLCDFFALIMIG